MSYIILQEKIKLKQWKIKKAIEDIYDIREKVNEKLEKSEKSEVLNKNGVAKDASLKVTINGLVIGDNISDRDDYRNKKDGGELKNSSSIIGVGGILGFEPYIKLTLKSKEIKTSFKESLSDAIWIEKYEFDVENLNDYLRIELFNKNSLTNTPEGTVTIQLNTLEHQNKIEENYPFKNTTDMKDINISLNLKIHLIWSNTEYLKSVILKLNEKEEKLQEEYGTLLNYENLCNKPFGLLLSGEIEEIVNSNILNDEPDLGALGRKSVFGMGRLSVIDYNSLKQSKGNFYSGRQSTIGQKQEKNRKLTDLKLINII